MEALNIHVQPNYAHAIKMDCVTTYGDCRNECCKSIEENFEKKVVTSISKQLCVTYFTKILNVAIIFSPR